MITNTKKKKKTNSGEWEKKTSMPTSHGTYIYWVSMVKCTFILNQKAHTMSEIENFMCFKGQTVRAMFIFMKVSDP